MRAYAAAGLTVICVCAGFVGSARGGTPAAETTVIRQTLLCSNAEAIASTSYPEGINTVQVSVTGGYGYDPGLQGRGGKPVRVLAKLPTPTAASPIYVNVGCASTGVQGGYNGGGDGADGPGVAVGAGGGGGASDLRTIPTGASGSLASRFLVAGGGGGVGTGNINSSSSPPALTYGGYGGPAGRAGGNGGGDAGTAPSGKGGGPGTQSAGGAAGAGGTGSGVPNGTSGTAGTLGKGGNGGVGVARPGDSSSRTGDGGGGGGGLYGGGGGGGGSVTTSDPKPVGGGGGGGGGGSSLVPVGGTASDPDDYTFTPSGSRVVFSYSYPGTVIDKAPPAVVKTRKRKTKVSFSFSSPTGATSFECAVDAGDYAPCPSPFARRFAKGPHTFSVRAINADSNRDQMPPEPVAFRVKRKR